jgi:S-adenosylmethionine hydrolase
MHTSNRLITLTSDFDKQSQGVALMHAIIYRIAPLVKVIDLMHGLPSYNIIAAARTLESVVYVPAGNHVCICDPGVGTARKAIVIAVSRGDYLIGPNNGVLISAASRLGGIEKAYEITNRDLMNRTVSPIFHGRDIFAPVAAYLCKGISVNMVGPELAMKDLVSSPYVEAVIDSMGIHGTVIQVNKFGSIHLNIMADAWDCLNIALDDIVKVQIFVKSVKFDARYVRTFGDAMIGATVILKDDYGRIEIAINQGSLAEGNNIEVGDAVQITYCGK